jgi:hypothetical protein
MSEDNVVPLRAHSERAGFQSALREWRKFAHRRGLVVASPTRLVGAERTFLGDSEDEGFGPKDYKLISSDLLFADLWLNKNEKALIEAIADDLLDMSEVDVSQCKAPSTTRVPDHEDERGRWDIAISDKHRVGTVVRVGEGAKKHYLLYLWDGGWYRVTGQPCFDLPLFGLAGLRERPEAPVMIHEGPKAMDGALTAADGRMSSALLANWMGLYCHVSWHGSDIGMEWTDWSVLRGRRVLIWPDMDEAGIGYARMLGRKLARMGGVIEYVQWGVGDIYDNPSWDWGDPLVGKRLEGLTRAEIRRRIQRIESPVDAMGQVLPEWERRSFLDEARGEVYQASRNYSPRPLHTFSEEFGKGVASKILMSKVNPFMGMDFLPGVPFGRTDSGRINLCPPHRAEPIAGSPLDREEWREICGRWLRKMIPDVQQRKRLLRKAAVALARPEFMSRHMIVMQGESGVGKSVFIDALINVAGRDRAASLFPDSIMNAFNHEISSKSIIGIHEIHSDDITRKQNASRLKELIANEHITIREKYRPDRTQKNVIHWFAATNERIPFTLEHGNDRFYFVRCAGPDSPRAKKKMDNFFREWVPKFEEPIFQERLYAAAKWLAHGMNVARLNEVLSRASRQKVWKAIELASMKPWEQFMHVTIEELYNHEGKEDHPVVFLGGDLIRLVERQYKGIGPITVQQRLNQMGYNALRRPSGGKVQRSLGNSRREVVWARKADLDALAARGDYGTLSVRSFFDDFQVD